MTRAKQIEFAEGDIIVNASVVNGCHYTYINRDARGLVFGRRVGEKTGQVLQLGEREAYELLTP